ncbi:MAG: bifunctional methionine sulfoxide reductase B/A protein [Phycisphaerae bacterium]|nr:bifunctional methionine sulfoxide reductase B/A protein [Phycisphaerae bacterium]
MYSQSGYDLSPLSEKRIDELARDLSPDERKILLAKGTERAGCGVLLGNKEPGTYACRLCELPLFSSDAKFESGTGWPSFFRPFDPAHVRNVRDTSHGMVRMEIQCARCGSHLGHVFNDGPPPTGLRYCMNSAALQFHKVGQQPPSDTQPAATATAYFAGGCFWGVEDRFQQIPGVIDAVSGYMGGKTKNPGYKEVCSGKTGHAETVRVTFDPHRVTYPELLDWFFRFHDPTQKNRQGPDVGTQYRSAIFVVDATQRRQAEEAIAALERSKVLGRRSIATIVADADVFYEAEAYHQDYHVRHGGSCPIPIRAK